MSKKTAAGLLWMKSDAELIVPCCARICSMFHDGIASG